MIVPTYNRRRLLGYTLDSLARQNISPEIFEVIVVDDGSVDDTAEMICKYRDVLNLKYFFQQDSGYRPGSARNIGIMNSEGEICLFVDSGIILSSQCVREHIYKHRALGDKVAVLGYVYGFDQGDCQERQIEELILPEEPEQSIANFKKAGIGFDIREKYYKKYNDRLDQLHAPWVLFWTCNVSIRREELIRAGLFDAAYDGRWGCEDNDLGFRLWQNEVGIYLCREAESIHFPHGKDMTRKLDEGYANCEYMHKKFKTKATAVFLENYKQIVLNEGVDINELIF